MIEVLSPRGEVVLSPRKKRRRGAPRIPEERHADAQVAQAVAQAEDDLREPFRIASDQKKKGGYASSDELIEEDLLERGYGELQVRSVMGAKTLRGAANNYVARKTRRKLKSVTAMACRGRQKLDRAKTPRRQKLTDIQQVSCYR